ncbi:hypothetical protein PMAYCL1PPCAC_30610 [Pristionchus mayeri]|uniref:Uncharacterized protein n=1 Tax=Pristionchus mayeri TaxID=1317129 RepID=A0AAN5DE31_9BILA|nr:hypothetical protein PMAYCL1PPCAC_30610 [Pristionchus mayeri]
MKTFAVLALLAVSAYAQLESTTPEPVAVVKRQVEDPKAEVKPVDEPVVIVKRDTDPSGSEPVPDIHIEISDGPEEIEKRQKRQNDYPKEETQSEPVQPEDPITQNDEEDSYREKRDYDEPEKKPDEPATQNDVENPYDPEYEPENKPEEQLDDKEEYRKKRDIPEPTEDEEEEDDDVDFTPTEEVDEPTTTVSDIDTETEESSVAPGIDTETDETVTEDDDSEFIASEPTTTELPQPDIQVEIMDGPTEEGENRQKRQYDDETEADPQQYGDDDAEIKPEEPVAQNDDEEDAEYGTRNKRDVATQENATRTRRSYVEEHGYPDCTCDRQYPHLPLYTALHEHCSCPGNHPHPHPHPPCNTCGHNHGPHVPCHGHGPVYHHHHVQVVPHPVPVHPMPVHPLPVHHVRHDVHHHFVPRKPHYRAPCNRRHHSHYDHDGYKH